MLWCIILKLIILFFERLFLRDLIRDHELSVLAVRSTELLVSTRPSEKSSQPGVITSKVTRAFVLDISGEVPQPFHYSFEPIIYCQGRSSCRRSTTLHWNTLPQCDEIPLNTYAPPAVLLCHSLESFDIFPVTALSVCHSMWDLGCLRYVRAYVGAWLPPLCGILIASAMWDLGCPRYVGFISHVQLCRFREKL